VVASVTAKLEGEMHNEINHSIIIQVEFMNELERKAYWLELASYDLETAESMLKTKRYLYIGFIESWQGNHPCLSGWRNCHLPIGKNLFLLPLVYFH